MADLPVHVAANGGVSRRAFVKTSAAFAAAATLPGALPAWALPRREERLRVGLIGCGGRGTGAAIQALTASPAAVLTAMGDAFPDRLASSLDSISKYSPGRVDVPAARQFTGFDNHEQVLASGVDLVLLCTPPHFRPAHLEAAIRAGVHVFAEKPVAVDAAGIRRVLDASRLADEKKLNIVAGTQRRYERVYLEALKRVRDGQIGEITGASCYWNMGGLWKADRQPEWSDMEWQLRNWLYFTWLSGDHIVEQHVHNLDVVNWFLGSFPERCLGMGGRQVRTAPEYGHIFDHFAVEYEYKGGIAVTSMARQIDGCDGRVQERIRGTKGTLTIQPGWARITGESPWQFEGENPNPYQEEHKALMNAIASGERINDGYDVARSTLTAIMGRMSAYSGKEVTWQQANESSEDLTPSAYEFGDVPMPEVPVPGRTPLV